LGEIDIRSGSDVTSKVLLEETDGFEGFLALLDGAHEELVAQALVVFEAIAFTFDFITAGFVPSKV
jgi:hypothetical protein